MRPPISPSARASSFLPGLPLRTRILTRRGWLTHDEVQPGDETIGYDQERGVSTWTQVERVVHYQQAEVWRFGDARWSVECTPEHRWLMEQIHRPLVERGKSTPPHCDWFARHGPA